MVKLTEVEDEHFTEDQQGTLGDAEFVDTDSEVSESDDDSDDESLEENIYDRLVALKDMIPPKHRTCMANIYNKTYGFLSSTLTLGGNTLWVVSTSVIMLGVPYALAVGDEQQFIEMEKEMKAQQLASSSLSPNAQVSLENAQHKI